jgi:hypothetical protein
VLVYAANGSQIDVYLHSGAPSGSGGMKLTPLPERAIAVRRGYTVDSVRVVPGPRPASSLERTRVDDLGSVENGSCSAYPL